MAKIVACLLCIYSSLFGHDLFPSMRVYGIGGEVSSLPRGKTDLVFVGFEIGARETLCRWHEALSACKALPKNVGCLAIPVLPEYMSRDFVRDAASFCLRKKVSARLLPYVWMSFADDAFQKLGISEKEHVSSMLYVFLVGKTGKILWRASGPPTPEGLEEIKVLAQSDQLSGCPRR